MSTHYIILGNQLLRNHPALQDSNASIIMIEAHDLCARFRYHKHKLVLLLTAMRTYRDFLESKGLSVTYITYEPGSIFMAKLETVVKDNNIKELVWMEPSDSGPSKRLEKFCEENKIVHKQLPNQQFITTLSEFKKWHSSVSSHLMESFYRWQRKRTGILMNGAKPEGDMWNYDHQNRNPLPKKGLSIPPLPSIKPSKHLKDVAELVAQHFSQNPGDVEMFWLPTDFENSDKWLDTFIRERSNLFGTYEDASISGEPFLFHSVLSPLLNCGLLEPKQLIDAALLAYKNGIMPLNSCEGFLRQVIGWREYMNGMYRMLPNLKKANYFGFTRELEEWWYTLEFEQQNLPIPVKAALKTVHTYGYNHHIERLMVLGNWFLLNEYNPRSVYEWFSSMYVDAYDWVMVPNVQGMSQYADGGTIATKPYISGGNYLQKMGRWWPTLDQAKRSDYNVLYWKFLNTNRSKLIGNPRMGIVLKMALKYDTSQS